MNLYVSNLSPDTNEEDLEKAFAEFGNITSLKIIVNHETGESKGFGFVEIDDKKAAMDAVDYLDMSYLKGNIINVREAKNNRGNASNNRPKRHTTRPSYPSSGNDDNQYRQRNNYYGDDMSY